MTKQRLKLWITWAGLLLKWRYYQATGCNPLAQLLTQGQMERCRERLSED